MNNKIAILDAKVIAENQKLKILLVINTLAHGGGAENLVFVLYNELKKRSDILVKLITFQHSSIFGLDNLDVFEQQLQDDPDFTILPELSCSKEPT